MGVRSGAYPWRALSSDDPRKDRALASDAQEPHPARKLFPAGRSRSPDRGLRRRLQSPAISREHQQPDARRRLLRAGPDHSDRKGKDQTTDNRQSPLAAHNITNQRSQRLSYFKPLFVPKTLTTDSRAMVYRFSPRRSSNVCSRSVTRRSPRAGKNDSCAIIPVIFRSSRSLPLITD